MKGLLIKDFIVIAKQLRLFVIVIPIMAIAGGTTAAPMAVLFGSMLPMTAMAYDERSRWDELAQMMPYSRLSLVLSKYLLGYICMLTAAAMAFVSMMVMEAMGKGSMQGQAEIMFFSICCGLIYIAINTPILIRLGSEKGRFVFIAAMILVLAAGPLLKNSGIDLSYALANVKPIIVLPAIVAVNALSVYISDKIKPRG